MGRLGDGMENMHFVGGPPSVEAFQRGRFQIPKAEPSMSRERDFAHPGCMDSKGLIRLEAEDSEPLLKYEEGLKGVD